MQQLCRRISRYFVALRFQQPQQIRNRERDELRQRQLRKAKVQRRGLVATAAAIRAAGVGTVAGQKNPYVHLVGLALEPIEKTLHSVPEPVLPELFSGHTRPFT